MFQRQIDFMTNLYKKGPFERHAFCCVPPIKGVGEHPKGDFTLSSEPVELWIDWLVENYELMVEWNEKLKDDSVPYAVPNTGTQIFPAAFGADAHVSPDGVPCAIPFINNPSDAKKVPTVKLSDSPTLLRIFEIIEKLKVKLGKDIYISVPDIQSGFDIAAMMWKKEDFFVSLATEPQAVIDLAEKCSDLLKEFLQRLRTEFTNITPCHCPTVWSPPEMGPWVSNDECGMFNTAMFERFCLPELIDLSETFGGVGMHCCADAEHQFNLFKKIPNFYAFNRVAGKKGYESLLDYFNEPQSPVHVLAWIEDEDIEYLIKRANPETRFIFCKYFETLDDAKYWLEKSKTIKK